MTSCSSFWEEYSDAEQSAYSHVPRLYTRIKSEKRELDILLSLSYTYSVNLQRKYRENEDHGEIW